MYKCIYVTTVDDKNITISKKDFEAALASAYQEGINEGVRRRDSITITPNTPAQPIPCPYNPPTTPSTPYWPNDFWWTHVTCQNGKQEPEGLTGTGCKINASSTCDTIEPKQLQMNFDTGAIE